MVIRRKDSEYLHSIDRYVQRGRRYQTPEASLLSRTTGKSRFIGCIAAEANASRDELIAPGASLARLVRPRRVVVRLLCFLEGYRQQYGEDDGDTQGQITRHYYCRVFFEILYFFPETRRLHLRGTRC